MTSLMQTANFVLGGMQEAQMATLIALYDKGYLNHLPGTRVEVIRQLLDDLGMFSEDVNHWLDRFSLE